LQLTLRPLAPGGGRDLLFGGLGADLLDGGADDDLLVGDATLYDADLVALTSLRAEWVRTDRTYDQRVGNLRAGGGLNGSRVLAGHTVSVDGAADVLTGGAGQDWFFLGDADWITDLAAGERTR
jgi:Ca2+-binding RTX toxin-like protein